MIKSNFNKIMDSIKSGDKVLDVGGAVTTFPRANYVIDFLPYKEDRPVHGNTEKHFTKGTWIQHDICKGNWPFKDKEFDFVVCSHVLEDVRDPLKVCGELIRVGKRGYIETPSRLCESTTGVARHYIAGYAHHRWFVEIEGNKIVFAMKHHKIHGWRYSLHPLPFFKLKEEFKAIGFFWESSFEFCEYYPASWKNYLKDFKKSQSLLGKTTLKH
jgi:hypothetical protein